MNELYNDFIEQVKEKSKSNNIIINYMNNDSIDYKSNDSIIDIKEYKKDFLTIGVVLLQKDIIKPIDYSDVDNIEIKSELKFYSKILLIDNKYEIDNIMVKSFDNLEDAKDYYNYLSDIIKDNDLQNLLKILKDNIK